MMEAKRLSRQPRTTLPPKARKPSLAVAEVPAEEIAQDLQSEVPTDPKPKASRAPAKRKAQPKPRGVQTMPDGPDVNLTIRVRQNVDDLVRACIYGLNDFGLRDVTKVELIEIAILQGLPASATEELAAQVREFRAKAPRRR